MIKSENKLRKARPHLRLLTSRVEIFHLFDYSDLYHF